MSPTLIRVLLQSENPVELRRGFGAIWGAINANTRHHIKLMLPGKGAAIRRRRHETELAVKRSVIAHVRGLIASDDPIEVACQVSFLAVVTLCSSPEATSTGWSPTHQEGE